MEHHKQDKHQASIQPLPTKSVKIEGTPIFGNGYPKLSQFCGQNEPQTFNSTQDSIDSQPLLVGPRRFNMTSDCVHTTENCAGEAFNSCSSPSMELVRPHDTDPQFLNKTLSENFSSCKKLQEEKSSHKQPTFNSTFLRKIWKEKDYEELLEMAVENRNDWKRIAKKLLQTKNLKVNPRGLKFLHDQYLATKPSKRARFTPEEDMMIIKYYLEYGLNWTKIASHFQDKSSVMIKNRFYYHIKKRGLLSYSASSDSSMESEAIDSPILDNFSPKENIKFILDMNEDIPILNQTYLELHSIYYEDILHEKVTNA